MNSMTCPSKTFPYIATRSGAHVYWDEGVPSLTDIAVVLGRIPRFAGHTRNFWSVLHHEIVGYLIVCNITDDPMTRLHWLLHDAHEAVTGDIPSPFKCDCMKELQDRVDHRLWEYFSNETGAVVRPHSYSRKVVASVDLRCLYAEAKVLGPLGGYDWVGDKAIGSDMEIVQKISNTYPSSEYTTELDSLGVNYYLDAVHQELGML